MKRTRGEEDLRGIDGSKKALDTATKRLTTTTPLDPFCYLYVEILEMGVFDYIPSEYWGMLACVSKLWRSVLLPMLARAKAKFNAEKNWKKVRRLSKRTFCKVAAANGHTAFVEWGKNNGCKFDYESLGYAAQRGHFETVKWIGENLKQPWGEDVLLIAAKGGHIDILEWLTENMPVANNFTGYSSNVTTNAAKRGHFEALKWLIESRFPYYPDTAMYYAANASVAHAQIYVVSRCVRWCCSRRSFRTPKMAQKYALRMGLENVL